MIIPDNAAPIAPINRNGHSGAFILKTRRTGGGGDASFSSSSSFPFFFFCTTINTNLVVNTQVSGVLVNLQFQLLLISWSPVAQMGVTFADQACFELTFLILSTVLMPDVQEVSFELKTRQDNTKATYYTICLSVCLVWSGLVWSGLVWSGLVWSGLVWSGLVWSGLVWSGLVWSGLVWSGLVCLCFSLNICIPSLNDSSPILYKQHRHYERDILSGHTHIIQPALKHAILLSFTPEPSQVHSRHLSVPSVLSVFPAQ